MPGAALARLPRELWACALAFVDLPALCACAAVCRAWRALCGGQWPKFAPRGVPPALAAPYRRPLGNDAQAALSFRGHVRHNTTLPRFRSGVLSVAPPAFHVALTPQGLFAAEDGRGGVVAHGLNMPDLGHDGIAQLGVLNTRAIVTCVAAGEAVLACGTEAGVVQTWALADLRPITRTRLSAPGPVYQLVLGEVTGVVLAASVHPGRGQHITVLDLTSGAVLATVAVGDDILRLYAPPVRMAHGGLWVVALLSHSLHWWHLGPEDAQGPGKARSELQYGRVEQRAAGLMFRGEGRLPLPAIPIAVAGSLAEPLYALVAPRDQLLCLTWPCHDAPPMTLPLRDLVPGDVIHKVCFSAPSGTLYGTFARLDTRKVGLFAVSGPRPGTTHVALRQGQARHGWLPAVRPALPPADALLEIAAIAADDFVARVFVLCSTMRLLVVDSATLLTLSAIQCFEPSRKGPLHSLVTQVQVRQNVVVVHPLAAPMQEANTLVLDFQPAAHMLCDPQAKPGEHQRSLDLLRRCWELKLRGGAESEAAALLPPAPPKGPPAEFAAALPPAPPPSVPLQDLLHGLAALERPGVVVLRSTRRHRLGHLPYAVGSLLMATVLGCSALLIDGRTVFGVGPLRYRWLIGPHCAAMLLHVWFTYPHLDYLFNAHTRGAELEYNTMLLTWQFFHLLTTVASHILLPVLVLLKMDGALPFHWAWIAACFQVRYVGRLLLYGWQWRHKKPIRERFPGLFEEGLPALWQVNTALFCGFSFLLAFWLEGSLQVPVTIVFAPIWTSLALLGAVEWVLPRLRATPPEEAEPSQGSADLTLFCVGLYVGPILAMYLRLAQLVVVPFLLVFAPHIIFLSVSFGYCLYVWYQNSLG